MNSYSIEVFDPPNVSDEQLWDNFYNFFTKFVKDLYPDDPVTPKVR